jgi:hypothetical protein
MRQCRDPHQNKRTLIVQHNGNRYRLFMEDLRFLG